MAGKLARTLNRGPVAQVSLGGPSANFRAAGNIIVYAASWIVVFAFAGAALPLRFTIRGDPYAPLWGVLLFLVAAGLTAVMWKASRPRGDLANLLATGAAGFAGTWLLYVVGVPDITWRPFLTYALVMLVACAGANAAVAFKGSGDGEANKLDEVGKAVDKVRNVNEVRTTEHGEVLARYQMQPGVPAADLQPDAEVIDALLPGVRPGATKVLASKDDATVGMLRISPVDRLAKPLPWPGPSIPWGGTADEPVRLGVRAVGGWSELYLCADPATMRTAPLVAVVGMSGAGKTILVRTLAIEVLSRFDVEYWYANARKFGQEPEWVRRGAAKLAEGRKATIQLIRDVKADVVERSNLLGAHGCEVWRSDCCYAKHGIRDRVVIVDEAAEVASDMSETLTDIGESVRSTGQVPVLIFQRGTGDRFPTSARAQFNAHICLGVQDEADAVHGGLPDDVLDAGAKPWLWAANAPGMHINATPGVPDDLRATDCRTFDTRGKAEVMAEWADRYIAAREADASPVTPIPDDVRAAAAEAMATPPPAGRIPDETDEELRRLIAEDDEADQDDFLAELAAEVAPHPDDQADMARINLDDPLPTIDPPAGDEVIALPKLPPSAARREVYAYLVRLRDGGEQFFRVSDHIEFIHDVTGMGGRWTYKVAIEFTAVSECGPAILRPRGAYEPYDILPETP
jgi:hypothetical protein